jgi:hypothetical protein
MVQWRGSRREVRGIVIRVLSEFNCASIQTAVNQVSNILSSLLSPGPSDFGGFLDITCDFVTYGAIVFAFALHAFLECFTSAGGCAHLTSDASAAVDNLSGQQVPNQMFSFLPALAEGPTGSANLEIAGINVESGISTVVAGMVCPVFRSSSAIPDVDASLAHRNHLISGYIFPACFLLWALLWPITSFLAYAIISAKRQEPITKVRGIKSFYYLGGITEGFETMTILTAVCLYPSWFGVICYIYGFLCILTGIGRTYIAFCEFSRWKEDAGKERKDE